MSTGFKPIDKIHLAFHAYHTAAHDHNQTVESYHFCAGGNDGVFQCLIYNSCEADAKLIGIEYLIPESMFLTLDAEEKRLWHSHKHEVASGLLLPLEPNAEHSNEGSGGLRSANDDVEKQQMQLIHGMYGKIIHTWHPPTQKLPLGAPALMTSLSEEDSERLCVAKRNTESTQIVPQRDQRHDHDTEQARQRRQSYLDMNYKIKPGCDAWKDGKAVKLIAEATDTKLSNGKVIKSED